MSNTGNKSEDNGWQITTITYNINGQKPSRDAISRWLDHEEDIRNGQIVCIALQEISHIEMFSAVSQCDSWTDGLNEWLNVQGFTLVVREHLASNLILVYCSLHLLHLIARVDRRWSRASLAGHKGTVSCRLLFKDGLSLVFLTSHFIHGEENLKLRLDQYRNSLQCTFGDEMRSRPLSPRSEKRQERRQAVFWLGDFNFRLEGYTDSPSTLISALNKKELSSPRKRRISNGLINGLLQHYDQLTKCRCSGKVFSDFQEPVITFPPSYRILVGDGKYDPLRMPSWCDRILYKTNGTSVSTLKYNSSREILISDHFPVSGVFRLKNAAKCAHIGDSDVFSDSSSNATIPPNNSLKCHRHTWNCEFETIPTWAPFIPFVCRFRVDAVFWRTWGAYRDWVAIYSADVPAIAKPQNWVYTLTCYSDDSARSLSSNSPSPTKTSLSLDGPFTTSPSSSSPATPSLSSSSSSYFSILSVASSRDNVRMVAEFPALPVGRYRVGYFSVQTNCLQGLSDVFVVEENCTI